ncbi:MAG: hypothetical protein WKF58_05290 [Ilumatobacteraceae bacterium]
MEALDVAKSTDERAVADYLGGVLAASGEDDAGTPMVRLIGRLSSRDLRTHYVLYREFQRLITPNLGDGEFEGVLYMQVVFIPTDELLSSIGCERNDEGFAALEGSLRNLAHEGLIGQVANGEDRSGILPPEQFLLNEPVAPGTLVQAI